VADAESVNVEIESQEVDDLVHDWKSPRLKIPVSNQYGVTVPTTDKINDMVVILFQHLQIQHRPLASKTNHTLLASLLIQYRQLAINRKVKQ
jgi:hypothetical protein